MKSLGIKGMEVHHLIEKRFAKTLGIDPDDIPSILLPKGDHQVITNAFRKEIGYAKDKNAKVLWSMRTTENIWKALEKVYTDNGMEQYIPILKQFLLKNSDKFRIWRID